jgi:hypothetical protein
VPTEPLQKAAPGDPFYISAEAYNALVEAAQAHHANVLTQRGGSPTDLASQILVKNDSGNPLTWCTVVALGDPVITPAANQREFLSRCRRQPVFIGQTPSSDTGGRFAILLHPAPLAAIVPAVCDGPAVCQVTITDEAHCYAATAAGVTAALASAAAGPAEILWHAPLPGAVPQTVWAVVRLMGQAALGDADPVAVDPATAAPASGVATAASREDHVHTHAAATLSIVSDYKWYGFDSAAGEMPSGPYIEVQQYADVLDDKGHSQVGVVVGATGYIPISNMPETFPPDTHNILSVTHPDTLGTIDDGVLMAARQRPAPNQDERVWAALPAGENGQVLMSGGGAPFGVHWADIPTHAVLSATHTDAAAAAVARAALIVGQSVDGQDKWSLLAAGNVGQVLTIVDAGGGAKDAQWQDAGAGTDIMVKVSANDTTAGYLNGKLVGHAGDATNLAVTLTEVGDGGNETLRVDVAKAAVQAAAANGMIERVLSYWVDVQANGSVYISDLDWRGRVLWCTVTMYDGTPANAETHTWDVTSSSMQANRQGTTNATNGDAQIGNGTLDLVADVTVYCEDNTGKLKLTASNYGSRCQVLVTVAGFAAKTAADATIGP